MTYHLIIILWSIMAYYLFNNLILEIALKSDTVWEIFICVKEPTGAFMRSKRFSISTCQILMKINHRILRRSDWCVFAIAQWATAHESSPYCEECQKGKCMGQSGNEATTRIAEMLFCSVIMSRVIVVTQIIGIHRVSYNLSWSERHYQLVIPLQRKGVVLNKAKLEPECLWEN